MYTDQIIHTANLMNYSEEIPVNYHDQIKKGEISAIATFNGEPGSGRLVGTTITASHAGWLEIIWFSMGEGYHEEVQAADYLRYVIRKAEKTGNYIGAFAEIHVDEHTEKIADILTLAGMELKESKNNNYEIAISEITNDGMLIEQAKRSECIFLEDASEEVIGKLEDKIYDDKRAIPVPSYMEWENYMGDLSVIGLEKGEPIGCLLFTEKKDYLIMELLFSASPKAIPGILGTALIKARELFPGDKKILMPLVGNRSAELVEKLAAGAKRGKIVEAVTWF